ncbi:hypothetical protein EW146_g2599 [Bondarzewia mesenterica]|uniref:F-box domain-containing protein n=1 Tax=Bondarzewia mesenterica TaxID=1095465 RepID=A0A4S4M037_9AGAM|nr:hypothetical protein EW146_g2599 [Bondarzewia mesenterica]
MAMTSLLLHLSTRYPEKRLVHIATDMITGIINLPQELVEELLLSLDPLDVSSFAQTCRTYNALIYSSVDQHFWRELYLIQLFDDPRACLTPLGQEIPSIDWKRELQRIIRARTIVEDPTKCRPGERVAVLQTLVDLACNVPPLPSVFSDYISHNLLWLASMLRNGALLDHTLWELSEEEEQLRARLHTYFGLTPRDVHRERKIEALAYVYDMRHYQYDNEFGPFMPDGSGCVNWVHLQALHHAVSMHCVDIDESTEFEFVILQMSMPYCQSVIPVGLDLDVEKDWAGIEGIWRCAFCFIDHRELILYNNFNNAGSDPLDPSVFADPEFREVYRVITVHFRMISTEHDPVHPTRPKLHIVGNVHDEITMVGHVSFTADNQLRWHLVSGEDGHAVWSMEGIQIGGVRSYFGVLGCWTTVFHDQHDPVDVMIFLILFRSTLASQNVTKHVKSFGFSAMTLDVELYPEMEVSFSVS